MGSALAAYLIGRLTQRRGRRVGLGTGFAVAAVGAAGAVGAAAQPAPSTLQLYTAGTHTSQDGRRAKAVVEGMPRIELGHTYLAAVSWEVARCSPGDAPDPARFRPLGERSVVPFDGDVIGAGEVGPPLERSVANQVVGKSSNELALAVRQTAPTVREVFSPPSPCS